MPITCLHIPFFSDKGMETSSMKLQLRMREFLSRSWVENKPAGAAVRACGPDVVKLINTALK